MNKQIKKSFIALLLFLGVFGVTAFANPLKHAGFMGEVVKVQKCENTKEMKLLVCGYLKGCEITKTQMVVICNKDTEIKDSCNKKVKDLEVKEGDTVCIELDSKMTKSIPPQATAKKIYVSKSEGKCKREEKVESNNSTKVEEEKGKENEKKVEAPKAEEKAEEKAELQ